MGKMTWGIPAFRLEQTFSGNVKADFALPGFNATISKGTIKLDLLRQKEDMVTSTVDIANIEYLPSKINFTGGDPRLGATWSVGPAFDFTLTPNMFLGGKKSWSDTHTHIMTPFAFGGALVCPFFLLVSLIATYRMLSSTGSYTLRSLGRWRST